MCVIWVESMITLVAPIQEQVLLLNVYEGVKAYKKEAHLLEMTLITT